MLLKSAFVEMGIAVSAETVPQTKIADSSIIKLKGMEINLNKYLNI